MTQKVTITIDGKTIELPVLEATEGLNVVDVRGLIKEGVFTFDPGFLSTASCESRVTYIDGDAGILMYRGYPIEQLAKHSNHLEVAYLLLNGELPNNSQYLEFESSIKSHQTIDPHFQQMFQGFKQGAHPMSMISAALAGLASLYQKIECLRLIV